MVDPIIYGTFVPIESNQPGVISLHIARVSGYSLILGHLFATLHFGYDKRSIRVPSESVTRIRDGNAVLSDGFLPIAIITFIVFNMQEITSAEKNIIFKVLHNNSLGKYMSLY